jgi:hypothetical protein
MLSGRYFPYHPKPQPDELLSSWIIRTAHGHGQQPYVFCHNIWRGVQIWTRDIDNLGTPQVWRGMAERTGVVPDRAWSTTLRSLEGEMIEVYPAVGFARWILPLGIYHRTRRRYGLQFCPLCFWQDEQPYFRRHWRLGWVTACISHGCRLLDRCPACGLALAPHRSMEITGCHSCSADLREAVIELADSGAIRLQVEAEQILAQGWGVINGWAFQRPFLFFEILRQVVRILTNGKRAARLRQAVISSAAIQGGDRLNAEFRDIEYLTVADREFLMKMAGHLMADWPHRFTEICAIAGVWWSWAKKENYNLPFAYEVPVKAALFRQAYIPTFDETRAAVLYLMRQGKYPSTDNLRQVLADTQHLDRVILSLAWRGR